MHAKKTLRWLGLIGLPALLATTIVSGADPAGQQGTVFRATTNYVSTDVIVRDKDGQVRSGPEARPSSQCYEDGVPQNDRALRAQSSAAAPSRTSPRRRLRTAHGDRGPDPAASRARRRTPPGRIFIIFIDDLHLQVSDTPRVKPALKEIRDTLVHENDLVGFVSTGPSSIEINPTYDFGHRRFDEAIDKVMGSGDVASTKSSRARRTKRSRRSARPALRRAHRVQDRVRTC